MMVYYQRLGLLMFIFGLVVMVARAEVPGAMTAGAIATSLGTALFLAPWRDD